jgi:hypothetical protein
MVKEGSQWAVGYFENQACLCLRKNGNIQRSERDARCVAEKALGKHLHGSPLEVIFGLKTPPLFRVDALVS